LPEHLQLFIVRVQRDQALIEQYEQEVIQFLVEVNEVITAINQE
jgi:hypothetical protein